METLNFREENMSSMADTLSEVIVSAIKIISKDQSKFQTFVTEVISLGGIDVNVLETLRLNGDVPTMVEFIFDNLNALNFQALSEFVE